MDSMILIIYRCNELYIIYYISILLHYQWSPHPRDMGEWDTNSKSHSISTTTHSSESWNYRLVGWLFFLSRVRWPRIFLWGRKQIKDKGAGIPLFSRNFALLSDVFANQTTSLMFPFRPTLFPKQPSEDGDKGNVGLIILPGCSQQYSVNFPSLLLLLFHSKSLTNIDLKSLVP